MKELQESNRFIERALEIARESITTKGGGPFGAVIVKDGEIVAEGHNAVTTTPDPTMHAEIMAIRNASKKLNTFDLKGCTLYSSSEPCSMCLSAIYWAHIDCVDYALTQKEAKDAGFDDAFIYQELNLEKEKRILKMQKTEVSNADDVFKMWSHKEDKITY